MSKPTTERIFKKQKKGILFIVLLFLSANLAIVAQEQGEFQGPFSAGVGPEWNMNSRHNFAGGAVAGVYYNLFGSFSVGLTATGSTNFLNTQVTEFAGLIRWYFKRMEHNGTKHTGLFAQLEGGAFLIMEEGERTVLPLIGLRGGYRLPLGSRFYIEPCGRLGYPFAFGIGLMAGISF